MRLFVGLSLPADVRSRLASLKGGLPDARWVAEENLHLSLRFIGQAASGDERDIDLVLQSVTGSPFDLTLTGFGAFAEEVVAPESNLLPVPDNMPDEKAAGFMMVYGTSYYALKQRANLQPGETLLVLGASGGVGLAAVELGKAMGAKVIAAASSRLAVPRRTRKESSMATCYRGRRPFKRAIR